MGSRPRHDEIINEKKAIVAQFNHFHLKLTHGTLQVWELELLDMVRRGDGHRAIDRQMIIHPNLSGGLP
jgi:hypothetical protein